MLLYKITFSGFIFYLILNKLVLGQDSSQLTDRIFNGKDVEIGERPFQVSLQNPNPFCGGTIISNRYILTAAHCLIGEQASSIRVVVGTINLMKPYETYIGKKIIINRRYSPRDSFKNDIALLEVSSPITFSNRVQAVKLPEQYQSINPGSLVIVSGWGRLMNGSIANILQEVVLEVTNQEKCRTAVNEEGFNLYDSQLCADDNDPSVRSGDCNGDSGGPLTDSNEVLVGVVSWSIKDPSCGSNKYPNVYTRVSDYIDWIRSNTKPAEDSTFATLADIGSDFVSVLYNVFTITEFCIHLALSIVSVIFSITINILSIL